MSESEVEISERLKTEAMVDEWAEIAVRQMKEAFQKMKEEAKAEDIMQGEGA